MENVEYKTTIDIFLDCFGGKWKSLIVAGLIDGAARPSQLLKRLPGLNKRLLTESLRELVCDGIVEREVFAEIPPRTEYSLTGYGRTAIPIIQSMSDWGEEHVRQINEVPGSGVELVGGDCGTAKGCGHVAEHLARCTTGSERFEKRSRRLSHSQPSGAKER
ncbi:MAG TPA: hypothetical protein DDW52_23610 [Planctomycetaceae bacterium]|nr:hypothetical protein [Planctomycetaceae bacterium]